jgi:hypothetical protein
MHVLSLQLFCRERPSAICLVQEIKAATDGWRCCTVLLLPAASRPRRDIPCLPAIHVLLLLLLAPA